MKMYVIQSKMSALGNKVTYGILVHVVMDVVRRVKLVRI